MIGPLVPNSSFTVGSTPVFCDSLSVNSTVIVLLIPAFVVVLTLLFEMIVGVPERSGRVLSIVTPDNVQLMGLGFLLPAASVAVTSSLFTVPEYAGTAGVPPDA